MSATVQGVEDSSWKRLADLLRDRLVLARLAGAGTWLAWLISLALGGWHHDFSQHRVGADHVEYYVVGRLVEEGHPEQIYDLETMTARQAEVGGPGWEGPLPFRYPPFYALCFALTSYFPYEASWLVWTALGFGALVLAGRLLGVPLGRWLGWALCFYPVFAAISFGQNSLLSLLLFAAASALWQRDRPFVAGLVAGLLFYKPQLLVGVGLLWLLDVRRSWRALAGLGVTGAVLLAVSVLALPDATLRFVETLSQNVTMVDRKPLAQLYSSQGFWMLLLPGLDGLARVFSVLTSLAGLGVFVFVWWRVRKSRPLAFAVAVLLTLWLSPYAMVYDWSILLVPAGLLWFHLPQERDRWLVLFAWLWLLALVSSALVRGQLRLSPFAVQLAFPALLAAILLAGRGLRVCFRSRSGEPSRT